MKAPLFILLSIITAAVMFWSVECGRPDPKLDNALDLSIANIKRLIESRTAIIAGKGARDEPVVDDEMWVAVAYKNIGLMLQSKGIRQHLGGDRLQREALENYNTALYYDNGRTNSLNIQIFYLKGMLLKMMGLGDESLAALDNLAPYELSDHDKAAAFFQRADTLQMMGRSAEASDFFKQSLALRPCKTERYYQYVNACKDIGALEKQDWSDILDEIQLKLKECEGSKTLSSLEDSSIAVEVGVEGEDPIKTNAGAAEDEEASAELPHSVATLRTKAKTSKRSRRAAQAASSPLESHLIFDDNDSEAGFSGPNSAVYWALYIAAEKAGRNALAWWYLEYANNLEKSLRAAKFDPQEATTQAKQISGAFTVELLDSLSYMKGKGSKVPIFIVGFMRSGSTLLETMLDSHSRIWGMGEDSFFNANLTEFRNKLVGAPNIKDTVAAKQRHLQDTLSGYGRSVVREMRALAAERDKTLIQTPDSAAPGADPAVVKDEKKSVDGKGVKAAKPAKKKVAHIVDKMLFNYRNIGFLHMVYPEALILHTIRDPMDTLFSCFRCKFDDAGLEWSLDAADLSLQYALYLEIMQHFRKVLPGRVMDIRYEDLVRQPEKVMREIIEKKLKLAWEPQVLDFHANNRSVQTHSQSQVKQKLYTHSMGSWTRYKTQLEPMSAELRKFLPNVRRLGALPFPDKINWDLDPNFDYAAQLLQDA